MVDGEEQWLRWESACLETVYTPEYALGGARSMGKKPRPARKKNKRMPPTGPAFIEPEDHMVICPHCHEALSTSSVKNTDGTRRCPSCGGCLTCEAFDEEAQRQIRLAKTFHALKEKRNRLIGYVKHAKIWKIYLIGALTSSIRHAIRRWIHRRFDPELERLGSERVPLDKLAESRYYCSDYFDATRTPLVFPATYGGYSLYCRYDRNGSFMMGARENVAWQKGLMAEITAFDALRAFASTLPEDSSANVLANLYVPKHQESCVHETGSYFSQTDMVLFTRKAAYVFEVKSKHKAIHWNPDKAGRRVEGRIQGDLNQLADHAYLLQRNMLAYPYERVYEILLYVHVGSFTGIDSFADNVTVATIRNGALSCAGAIRQMEQGLEPLMSDVKLQELVCMVQRRFGDQDLRKRQMHLMRLARKNA